MNTADNVTVNGVQGEVLKWYEDGSALIRFRVDQTPEDFHLFGPEVTTRRHESHEITKGVA